jgi:pimeloyl-ACP methyl ester carboxylesterase
MMKTAKLGAHHFSYDEAGHGPIILMLSGWCQDHRLFKSLMPELAKTNRVIRFDWRGHGDVRNYNGDFTSDDLASDAQELLDRLGVETAISLSTSHGGWANIELADRAGIARIPRVVVIDWIMVKPSAAFFAALAEIQDEQHWQKGINDLFAYWIGDTKDKDIVNHVQNEMAGYDYEMWARSGREIAKAYRKWGSPLERMKALRQVRPITHIFSQPFEPEYLQAQTQFSAANPWFQPVKLAGRTHFPTLEQPKAVAKAVQSFLDET